MLTPEVVNGLLSELNEAEKVDMIQFLPESQKNIENIAPNVRSPQFKQAI